MNTIFIDTKRQAVPIHNALSIITDEWISSGDYCDDTLITMRDALRHALNGIDELQQQIREERDSWRRVAERCEREKQEAEALAESYRKRRDELLTERDALTARAVEAERARDSLLKPLIECVETLDTLGTFHRRGDVWKTIQVPKVIEEAKAAIDAARVATLPGDGEGN